MVRCSRSALTVVVGLLLSAAALTLTLHDIGRYRAAVRKTFRTSCIQRVAALEEFAEDWIVRGDVRSLESAARLLVMGSGLYVDAVVRGELLVSRRQEDGGSDPVDPATPPPAGIVIQDLRGGAIEVRTPIVLAGYPETPIGFLRVAFSGEYASELIHRRALIASGIGLAGWIAACSVLAIILRATHARRQSASGSASIVRSGQLEIDTRTCAARWNGDPLDLTPKLYDLLLVFARDPGAVFSDDDLLQSVWPDSPYAASADVKQHIYLLRRKLGDVHPNPKALIETVKGFGYRFVPTANEEELSAS